MTLQNICWTLAQLFAEPGWDHSLNPKANAMYNDQKSTFFTQLSKQGASNPSSFENADVLTGLLESTHTTTESVETKTETITCENTECLGCNHHVCNECWTTYLESRVTTDRIGSIFAKCPQSGCQSICNESIFKKYCNENTFKTYERHVSIYKAKRAYIAYMEAL